MPRQECARTMLNGTAGSAVSTTASILYACVAATQQGLRRPSSRLELLHSVWRHRLLKVQRLMYCVTGGSEARAAEEEPAAEPGRAAEAEPVRQDGAAYGAAGRGAPALVPDASYCSVFGFMARVTVGAGVLGGP